MRISAVGSTSSAANEVLSVEELMKEGIRLHRSGDDAAAVKQFDAALKQEPQHLPALIGRAFALTHLGDLHDAEQAFELILNHHPNSWQAHVGLGDVLAMQAGRSHAFADTAGSLSARALEHYQSAVNIDADNPMALHGLAMMLRQNRRTEEALQHYDKIIELDPNNVDAIVEKGEALHALRRPEEARSSFERALGIDGNHSGALEGHRRSSADLLRSSSGQRGGVFGGGLD